MKKNTYEGHLNEKLTLQCLLEIGVINVYRFSKQSPFCSVQVCFLFIPL